MADNWKRVTDIRDILKVGHIYVSLLLLTTFQDAYDIYQVFSSGSCLTLWHALLVFEQLQSAWEAKQKSGRFILYYDALSDGLNKLKKYYSRFDYKPVYVLALGNKSCHVHYHDILMRGTAVLHPYYKMVYIKKMWGGDVEQQADQDAGNPYAINWQDMAERAVETAVSITSYG